MTIQRFKEAQDQPDAGFGAALKELQNGAKRSHWIWYIFPQVAGLGTSELARAYAIRDRAEAVEYLRDPLLRERLLQITTTALDQAKSGVPLTALMGSRIDVSKLASSMTLFAAVAKQLSEEDHSEKDLSESEGLAECKAIADAAELLLSIAAAAGFPPCQHTRDVLGLS